MPDPADMKIVRVRGGAKGFRMISLGDWKQELREMKGRSLPVASKRQARAEQKRKNKRKAK